MTTSIIKIMSQRGFLYSLQLIDSQIDKILDRINVINTRIQDEELVTNAQFIKNEAEQKATKKQSEIRKLEDQINSIVYKKKESEKELYGGKIKNPKELQLLQEEISSLKNRISQLEDELFNLMIENETLEHELQAAETNLLKITTDKAAEVADLESEKTQLLTELNVLKIEEEPIQAHIDSDLLNKYQKLRISKNRLAVVIVEENACSGCGNSLTLAELQKIKSPIDEYYCPVCKRILYYG